MDSLDWWERLGFPTAVTATLLYGLFKGGAWVGAQVLLPLRQRHEQFLARTEELLGAQGETLSRLAQATGQVRDSTQRLEAIFGTAPGGGKPFAVGASFHPGHSFSGPISTATGPGKTQDKTQG